VRRKQGGSGAGGAAPDLPALVAALRADPRLGRELRHEIELPAVAERTAALDPPLPSPLAAALAAGGVDRLWSHQAEALAHARAGRDVLVTTATASGKSLVFQLPVLEEAVRARPGRALFLFPLKALGQDQKAKLARLAAAAGLALEPPDGEAGTAGAAPPPLCEIYDGDTPAARRTEIRRRPPRVLVTNPDMLHLGILAHWPSWGPFLADLRWVVLDELHVYRGIFGSHFHHVLQRLLRVARALGAEPSIVASSATAADAGGFAAALAGRPFRLVETSGAPRGARHLALFRPSASPYTTALELVVRLLEAGLKTIVFTKARRITELLYAWLRERDPALARRVASYRSGFLPEERRKIEGELFAGRLDGVISTSALEMGIDVGGLDACVLVGWPGSVMATWQRSGRAGRTVDGAPRASLTALVALPDALDQWFLDHPTELVARPCERLVVDPANRPVASAHLVCAAAEMPLVPGPEAGGPDDGPAGPGPAPSDAAYLAPHGAAVDELLERGKLLESAAGDGELHARSRRPHRRVGLRGGGATWRIVRAPSGRTVGTVDGVRVLRECHPGAVYLHAGRTWLVESLDPERRHALAERAELDYYTQPLTDKETEVLEVLDERIAGPLAAWLGRVRVTERVVGFERRRVRGREAMGREPLDLPPARWETTALWWAAPRAVEATLRRHGEDPMGALHAAEHASIALFPLVALCDRNDLGGISYPHHPQVGAGAVFVYDGHPGGAGLAAAGFAALEELLARVAEAVAACPCEAGCPSCVQSPKCGNGNRPLDKSGAVRTLRLLLGREEPVVTWGPPPRLRLAERPVSVSGTEKRRIGEGRRSDNVGEASRWRGTQRPRIGEGSDGDGEDEPPRIDEGNGHRQGSPDLFSVVLTFFRRLRRPSPLAPWPAGGTVVFDLETLRSAAEVGGWGNAHRMGVAVGVAWHLERGKVAVFGEAGVGRLAATLAAADLVVGFNVKRFDYRVLAGYTGVDHAAELPTLDLLEDVHRRIGFRVGLGHLALETLGQGKSADGLQSLAWVRQGRLDLVEDYCRRDVEVLRDLYLHGRREGFVCYRDRKRDARLKIRVTW